MRKKLFLLLLLFIVPTISDWGDDTLVWFAQESYQKGTGSKECLEQVKDGALYPLNVLRDWDDQNYYGECKNTNALWCDPSMSCQDCTSGEPESTVIIEKMNQHITNGNQASGCDEYYEYGIASTYFVLQKNFWHQVKGEKATCQKNFEDKVDSLFINGQYSDWTVQYCGIDVTANDFSDWTNEFVGMIGGVNPAITLQSSAPFIDTKKRTETVTTSLPCAFENVNWLLWVCKPSDITKKGMERWGDPFSILFLFFLIWPLL